ncbi:hypothetical protein GTQ40_04145 [Flavobacteriaceae bacterium R38]|nr:hypothetical protein [Flavobacteriaceae bacterium R38]
MKKLLFKSIFYALLLLLALEGWVRIFHLSKDNPVRFVDEYEVEKWRPKQNGYSVTGNRRQNFSEYRINNSGFNSYREFDPSKDKVEVALVGDSFIEGFHQHYYNSIGKKIENEFPGIEVYEYGYAGYDMADQLHLMNAYKEQFDLIDHVILGVKFSNDLTRGEYAVIQSRMKLESPMYRALREIKLLVYLQNIGALDPVKELISKVTSGSKKKTKIEKTPEQIHQETLNYIDNFESLINSYGFDKKRFTFLLDSEHTNPVFLTYLDKNNYEYIDFAPAFGKTKKQTTLIYDKHWNNLGRSIIAEVIVEYLKGKN